MIILLTPQNTRQCLSLYLRHFATHTFGKDGCIKIVGFFFSFGKNFQCRFGKRIVYPFIIKAAINSFCFAGSQFQFIHGSELGSFTLAGKFIFKLSFNDGFVKSIFCEYAFIGNAGYQFGIGFVLGKQSCFCILKVKKIFTQSLMLCSNGIFIEISDGRLFLKAALHPPVVKPQIGKQSAGGWF